jgi:hypothetical protein
MAQSMPPIRIIAQPKASYRERYMCEMRRNRPQRFIRAEDDNPDKYVYPTVEVNYKSNLFASFSLYFLNRFQLNGLIGSMKLDRFYIFVLLLLRL